MVKEITYDELHKRFTYNPDTGLLINKKTNELIGKLTNQGYIRTSINNKAYAVHHIVYCMYYGYFPLCEIDHINRIKSDNRIENLRDVSRSCNARNRGNNKKNKFGVKGVQWITSDDRWKATIGIANKNISVGNFRFFINAVKARAYAEKIFNHSIYNKESPAVKYLKSVEHLQNNKKRKFKKNSAYSEWEFFWTVRKKRIDKLAEIYQRNLTLF